MDLAMAQRLVDRRKAAGLSQEALAAQLGVSRQAVSKWESGQTVPDAVTVARLCDALHVPAGYVLLGGEPELPERCAAPTYTMAAAWPCRGRTSAGNTHTLCE